MKALFYIFAIAFLLAGCATGRQVTTTQEQQQRDSTHTKVVTKTYFVTDTVYLEIPAQTAERTTADSTSHLENDYATSDARINPDGTLYHDLATKPQEIPKEVQIPAQQQDSIVYRYKYKYQTVTETVEVERKLSWWQQTQIYGFWVALLVILIVCRRNILSLIKHLI